MEDIFSMTEQQQLTSPSPGAVVEEMAEEQYVVSKFTTKWSARLIYMSFANFLISGAIALFMRADQAGNGVTTSPVFYQILSAHGIGMFVGWQFPFTYGLSTYVLSKFLRKPVYNENITKSLFYIFGTGFYLVWLSILLGIAPGWYFLFPLPFAYSQSGTALWGPFQASMFFVGYIVINASLAIFGYNVFRTVFTRYGSGNTSPFASIEPQNGNNYNSSPSAQIAAAIGLDAYLPYEVRKTIQPFSLPVIGVVVTTIGMLVSSPTIIALVTLGLIKTFDAGFALDYLLTKNLIWFNYHPIVYFAFFPIIGMYYFLMPKWSGKNFHSERWARAPWPFLLIADVGVYSHHLFMDSVQPFALVFMSQTMTYLIGLASGISVFTLLSVMYKSKFNWNLGSKFIFASIVAWIIGGASGEEQGTLAWDVYLHNTYSVPAHFHFNGLAGIVMAAFGLFYMFLPEFSGRRLYSQVLGNVHFWLSTVGAFGMASMFLILGYMGAPRREYQLVIAALPFTNAYTPVLDLALFFALVLATGQIVFVYNMYKTWRLPRAVVTETTLREVDPQVVAAAPPSSEEKSDLLFPASKRKSES
jgi:cytochrome c oxidase subunit 1